MVILSANKKPIKNQPLVLLLLKLTHFYPQISLKSLKKELFGMESKITVHCNRHNKPFPVIARVHCTAKKNGKGVGCKDCKSDLARERYRKPFEDLKSQLSKSGFTLLTTKDSYKSQSEKVKVRCKYDHVTTIVANKLIAGGNCSKCSGSIGEEICRYSLEKYFRCKLSKKRFKEHTGKYKYLEVDGYNENKRIAFEYQGAPHQYQRFHGKGKEAEIKFKNQIARDSATKKMCKKLKIRLITIELFKNPFKLEDIYKKINNALSEAGFKKMKKWKRFNPYKQVINNRPLHKDIVKVCKSHNLNWLDTILDKRDTYYKFKCNSCDHRFESTLYILKNSSNKCCPKCSLKIGQKKSEITRRKNNAKRCQKSLNERLKKNGFTLLTKNWHGTSKFKYKMQCNKSGKIFRRTYNTIIKKYPLKK